MDALMIGATCSTEKAFEDMTNHNSRSEKGKPSIEFTFSMITIIYKIQKGLKLW